MNGKKLLLTSAAMVVSGGAIANDWSQYGDHECFPNSSGSAGQVTFCTNACIVTWNAGHTQYTVKDSEGGRVATTFDGGCTWNTYCA